MSFESFIRLKKFWDCKYATYIRLALCSNLRVASIMFWSLILTLVQRHNKHARRGNYSSNSEDKIWSFCMTTFWKCPTTSVESTRCAAFPKKVLTPVAMTTASISPCLHVEPENTSSPVLLVTGRDSPVRADCTENGLLHYRILWYQHKIQGKTGQCQRLQ